MSSKPIIYDAEDVSNELGQALHDLKRKMLKEYRAGATLRQAANDFIDRCNYEFERIAALMDAGPDRSPQHGTETDENGHGLNLSHEQISEIAGTISRHVNASLQTMEEAMRKGATPYDAFFKFGADVLRLVNDHIPQAKYGGVPWSTFRDDIDARANAIINNETDRYDDETKNAIAFIKEQMSVPGNEKKTHLEFDDFAAWVNRAECGESLNSNDANSAANTERAETETPETPERPRIDLSTAKIEHCVATILATGDEDTARPYALMLLLDEIENGDHFLAVTVAKRAAMASAVLADRMADILISKFRPKYANCEIPAWTIENAVRCFENETTAESEASHAEN